MPQAGPFALLDLDPAALSDEPGALTHRVGFRERFTVATGGAPVPVFEEGGRDGWTQISLSHHDGTCM